MATIVTTTSLSVLVSGFTSTITFKPTTISGFTTSFPSVSTITSAIMSSGSPSFVNISVPVPTSSVSGVPGVDTTFITTTPSGSPSLVLITVPIPSPTPVLTTSTTTSWTTTTVAPVVTMVPVLPPLYQDCKNTPELKQNVSKAECAERHCILEHLEQSKNITISDKPVAPEQEPCLTVDHCRLQCLRNAKKKADKGKHALGGLLGGSLLLLPAYLGIKHIRRTRRGKNKDDEVAPAYIRQPTQVTPRTEEKRRGRAATMGNTQTPAETNDIDPVARTNTTPGSRRTSTAPVRRGTADVSAHPDAALSSEPEGGRGDVNAQQGLTGQQDVDTPGQNIDTSGQNIDTSGQNIDTPGQNINTPGQNVEMPGQTVSTPGQSVEKVGV